MKEVSNILRIFREVRTAITEQDSYKIKKLSDQTIHTATISQDSDNIIVAVLVYSVGKIVEREHYRKMPGWKKFRELLIKNWEGAISALEKKDMKKFREAMGHIRHSLNKIDENLAIYIKQVFEKAQINKAFKIYEHGLSSRQVAELLGVSLWDMASYIGQSRVHEEKLNVSLPERKRIKMAEGFFR